MKNLFQHSICLVFGIAVVVMGQNTTTDTRGSLVFNVSPIEAIVTVDGQEFGSAAQFDGRAAVLDVAPGAHIVKLTAEGYLPFEKRVYISDSRETIEIQLRPTGSDGSKPVLRMQTRKIILLYGAVSGINPANALLPGGGIGFEFGVNKYTDFDVRIEILARDSSYYAAVLLGSYLTPFNGDLRPKIGLSVGFAKAKPDQKMQVVIAPHLMGIYDINSKINLFAEINPQFLLGNNEDAFYLNMSVGIQYVF